MIKKFFTFLCLCLLCIGSAWGENVTYVKVTSAPTDWSGEYLLVYESSETDGIAWSGKSATETYANVTISNKRITIDSSSDAVPLKIASMDGGYSIYSDGESKGYIKGKSGSNELSFADEPQLNTIEFENDGVKITSNTSVLRWNDNASNGHLFRYYKSTSYSGQKPVQLYKKEESKTLSTISVKTAPTKLTYTEGEKFDPAGLVITAGYSDSSTEDIAYSGHESDFTFEPSTNAMLLASNTSVAITYGGKTCTQDITVNEATKYAVTFIGETEQGTLTVKVNNEAIVSNTNLLEGTTVSLTSTPKTGYKQASTPFEVKDADGEEVKVSKSDDVYSFKMPAKGVTITAKFVAIYKINVADGIQGGTIKIQDKDGNEITETSKGSKVVVAVTPNEHHSLTSLYYIKEGEETHKDIVADDKGVYSFTMIESAVTVYATFAEDAKYTVTFSINGIKETKENYAGEVIEFPENPSVEGYTFMGWTTEAINGTQDNAPEYVENVVYPENNDAVFYAVFATSSPGESETATLNATGLSTGSYKTGSKKDNKNQTWTYYAAINNQSGTIMFSLNSHDDNHNIGSPEFPGNISAISLKAFNGSSSANRKFFICSSNETAKPTSGDIAEVTISKSEQFKNTYNVDLSTAQPFKQFYIYCKDALGVSEINVTYSSVTYSDYCTFIPAEVTITAAKYATLGLPYAVTIPEGVSAYTATVKGTTVTMTKIQTGKIPADCGVILYADVDKATTYTFYGTTTEESYPDNNLVAVTNEGGKDITGTEEGIYFLSTNTNGVVFKLANSGKIPQYKAYLQSAGSEAKLDVVFGEPTGIESLTPALSEGKGVYNLNGMKVNEAYKGIVIMNGKKYINK